MHSNRMPHLQGDPKSNKVSNGVDLASDITTPFSLPQAPALDSSTAILHGVRPYLLHIPYYYLRTPPKHSLTSTRPSDNNYFTLLYLPLHLPCFTLSGKRTIYFKLFTNHST